jgi:hypothetical protein
MISTELPYREWVLLEEAVSFAMMGAAYCEAVISPRELEEFQNANGTLPRRGALFAGIEDLDFNYSERARIVDEFERKLSDAAFAKRVRFTGVRHGQREREEIPFEHFKMPRGFYFGADKIEPNSARNAKHGDEAEWREVLVFRADIVAWLEANYPQVLPSRSDAAEGAGAANSTALAAPIRAPYKTGAPGRPTSMHQIKLELDRRVQAGEISTNANARQLSCDLAKWYENVLRKNDQNFPPIAAETIRKALRGPLRAALSALDGMRAGS